MGKRKLGITISLNLNRCNGQHLQGRNGVPHSSRFPLKHLAGKLLLWAAKFGPRSEPNSEDEANATGKRRRHGRGFGKENVLLSAALKAHPISGEPRRIQTDVLQVQALAWKLDAEKGIEDNVLSSVDQDKLDAEKSHGGSMGPLRLSRSGLGGKSANAIDRAPNPMADRTRTPARQGQPRAPTHLPRKNTRLHTQCEVEMPAPRPTKIARLF
ncbi:hypothetical protein EJ110_NYTH49463 [Nymphaea thermarum]|nr:hypothetical protein EJ110_NYTH49463 [Nymphaea thermarum]